MKQKILHLPLEARYFEMIQAGIKDEEYRKIKPYWVSRIGGCRKWCSQTLLEIGNPNNKCKACENLKDLNQIASNRYDAVCFRLGYTSITMTFRIKSITVGRGKKDWGAPDEDVFIIRLGEKIHESHRKMYVARDSEGLVAFHTMPEKYYLNPYDEDDFVWAATTHEEPIPLDPDMFPEVTIKNNVQTKYIKI